MKLVFDCYLLLLALFNQYLLCASTPFKCLLTTTYSVQPVLTLLFNSVQALTYYSLLCSTSTYPVLQLRSETLLTTTYSVQLVLTCLFNFVQILLTCFNSAFKGLLTTTDFVQTLLTCFNFVQTVTYHSLLCSSTPYLALPLRSNTYLPLLTGLYKLVHSVVWCYLPRSNATYCYLPGLSLYLPGLLPGFKCSLLLAELAFLHALPKCFRACPKAISAHKCNSKVPLASAKVSAVHCIA